MTDELPPDVEAPIRWLEDVLAREREYGWRAIDEAVKQLDLGEARARLLVAVLELARERR